MRKQDQHQDQYFTHRNFLLSLPWNMKGVVDYELVDHRKTITAEVSCQ